mmetsp:Transcript_8180/g.20203  ORF Transcript_8180/g.20203 Transcript_8180/m.20203 type:complete len:853 (-) Transcript_8180:28-2586(-)
MQRCVGKEALSHQVRALPLRRHGSQVLSTLAIQQLQDLYETIADLLSRQYAGSDAHRQLQTEGMEKATGSKIQKAGKEAKKEAEQQPGGGTSRWKEMFTSFRRQYANTFEDGGRQHVLNIFLGVHDCDTLPLPWKLESDLRIHHVPAKDILSPCWWKQPLLEYATQLQILLPNPDHSARPRWFSALEAWLPARPIGDHGQPRPQPEWLNLVHSASRPGFVSELRQDPVAWWAPRPVRASSQSGVVQLRSLDALDERAAADFPKETDQDHEGPFLSSRAATPMMLHSSTPAQLLDVTGRVYLEVVRRYHRVRQQNRYDRHNKREASGRDLVVPWMDRLLYEEDSMFALPGWRRSLRRAIDRAAVQWKRFDKDVEAAYQTPHKFDKQVQQTRAHAAFLTTLKNASHAVKQEHWILGDDLYAAYIKIYSDSLAQGDDTTEAAGAAGPRAVQVKTVEEFEQLPVIWPPPRARKGLDYTARDFLAESRYKVTGVVLKRFLPPHSTLSQEGTRLSVSLGMFNRRAPGFQFGMQLRRAGRFLKVTAIDADGPLAQYNAGQEAAAVFSGAVVTAVGGKTEPGEMLAVLRQAELTQVWVDFCNRMPDEVLTWSEATFRAAEKCDTPLNPVQCGRWSRLVLKLLGPRTALTESLGKSHSKYNSAPGKRGFHRSSMPLLRSNDPGTGQKRLSGVLDRCASADGAEDSNDRSEGPEGEDDNLISRLPQFFSKLWNRETSKTDQPRRQQPRISLPAPEETAEPNAQLRYGPHLDDWSAESARATYSKILEKRKRAKDSPCKLLLGEETWKQISAGAAPRAVLHAVLLGLQQRGRAETQTEITRATGLQRRITAHAGSCSELEKKS